MFVSNFGREISVQMVFSFLQNIFKTKKMFNIPYNILFFNNFV